MRQKPHPGNRTQGFIDLDILRLKKKTKKKHTLILTWRLMSSALKTCLL